MSTVTWNFESLDQMAAYFTRKAEGLRARLPNAGPQRQKVLQAEAYAYEQAADIIRNTVIASH